MSHKTIDYSQSAKGLELERKRSLLREKRMLTHALLMQHMKVDNLAQLETEEDILAAAVALTR